jgi:hypothetical protein
MVHKGITVFTLLAFALFSMSCVFHTTQERSIETLAGKKASPEIVGVQTKTGEYIEFGKTPARIRGDAVVGAGRRKVEINKDDVQNTEKDAKGRVNFVTTKDGKRYESFGLSAAGDKYDCVTNEAVSILLSDIRLVSVRTVNALPTFLANLGLVVVVGALVAVLINTSTPHVTTPPGSSCPFLYSYDGENYVFDAELYGAAICQGLKRTEWASMDNLKEVNGQYRILLTNQLNETQYTDELKLIAVDHPRGLQVVPGNLGRIHTFSRPLPPSKAYDQKDRDILPLVAKNDKLFWVSPVEEKDPEKKEDLRDELTFEFPKPEDAKQVKLLANAWTSMWGSQVAKEFLEVRGRSLPEWYADVNAHGPEYFNVLRWHQNEELYLLKVWVETPSGWQVRAVINGGGPYISKNKAYILDVGDVPGKTLRLRLRPPVNFWMLNELAVDYSQDVPVHAVELAPASAIDQDGQDVKAKLAAMDNDYLVAANRGDRVELTFPAPPLTDGLDRTVLIKATGYYDIHLDARGEPQKEVADRILNEPGYAAQFALKEYLKWEAGLRVEARKH